jgi:glycosyltransferase involved in cell wall biosynthesis
VRILIVVSEAPPVVSGISRCVDHLTVGLRSRGHTIDVISSADVPRLMIGEFRLSSFGLLWPTIARRLPEYDVVNLHGPVPTMSDLFLLFSLGRTRIRRPRILYTHHSAIDIDGLKGACAAYNRVHDALARTADRIIVTSQAYHDLLATPGGPPIDVVPWGVDPVADSHRAPRRSPEEPLRVLFVGQMRPYKGLDTLLRAVAKQPALSLTLVGSGALLEHYRSFAAALGATNATFTGHVGDGDLRSYYREHDVVVLPSTTRAEAFGLVLLEGMACGCVPVASDLPGVREVASKTGFVVPPRDADALRRVLVSLAADPARLQRLQQLSIAAAAHMAWDRVVERYEGVLFDTLTLWHATRARPVLPSAWSTGNLTLPGLISEFNASWASLLLFRAGPAPEVVAAWGRARLPELRRDPPRVSSYVAVTGRPYLLDHTCRDRTLRELLRRSDVHSAMSVPFRCGPRLTGVVNLSMASGEERAFLPNDLGRLRQRLWPRQNGKPGASAIERTGS